MPRRTDSGQAACHHPRRALTQADRDAARPAKAARRRARRQRLAREQREAQKQTRREALGRQADYQAALAANPSNNRQHGHAAGAGRARRHRNP